MQAVLADTRPDFLHQFVERVLFAVMRGQDGHAAAPHEQSEGRFHKLRQVVHKGGLVDDDAALLGSQGARFGRKPPHAEAGSKADSVHGNVPVFILQHHFFQFRGHKVEHLCPVRAVADEGLGHFLVIRQVKRVLSACVLALGGFHSRFKSQAVGRTDSA